MTRVKVCGIMNEEELEFALEAGADALGFVVEIGSSRHCLTLAEASKLIRRVPVYGKSVAVIAPEDVDEAVRIAEATGADVLQLHSSLEPSGISKLARRVDQKLVAAVSVEDGGADARRYALVSDAVLLDSVSHGVLGGTGAVHDWRKSASIARSIEAPVILAGGLYPGNVAEAIKMVRPYAVDASSGLETDGRKDLIKIESFVREVRGCLPQQ